MVKSLSATHEPDRDVTRLIEGTGTAVVECDTAVVECDGPRDDRIGRISVVAPVKAGYGRGEIGGVYGWAKRAVMHNQQQLSARG